MLLDDADQALPQAVAQARVRPKPTSLPPPKPPQQQPQLQQQPRVDEGGRSRSFEVCGEYRRWAVGFRVLGGLGSRV